VLRCSIATYNVQRTTNDFGIKHTAYPMPYLRSYVYFTPELSRIVALIIQDEYHDH